MDRISRWWPLLLLSAVMTVQAETVNLSGIISNSSGQAVTGAIVTLIGPKLKDTTDASGKYSFVGSTSDVHEVPQLSSRQKIAFSCGVLSIGLSGPSSVAIELFDMRGQLLDRIAQRTTAAGEYRFDVTRHRSGAQMLLLRVCIGNQTSIVKYTPSVNGWNGGNAVSASTTGAVLAKTEAVVDTLKVAASGFTAISVALDSYTGVKNISLSAEAAMEKFSFFVTSMAGLQELSGSEKGFGGDYRFGKTGNGAGLLGADSICACLAEKSMPGSSSKKWSAFLSATKGVDGNVVNAIDRVGTGPWYDRLGRLVANNKSELIATRPATADAAIKNDLPNEYGVPNHRPDPTQPIVDNHMTVTGSDSLGKLYAGGGGGGGMDGGLNTTSTAGYTCADWTSTDSAPKPRVGMSWPQSTSTSMRGGMNNWISAMNASGCEPGIDLDPKTGPGVRGVYTIGNGGGYGGFYCFAHKP